MYFNIIKISNKNSEFRRHARPSCNNCSLFLSRKNRVDEMASIHDCTRGMGHLSFSPAGSLLQ